MSEAHQLFEYSRTHKGIRYTYNSDTQTLYTKKHDEAYTYHREMSEMQALRLLMDIVEGTVKPISKYFSYGRGDVGTCVRCGGVR